MSNMPRELVPGVFWIGDCQVQRVRGKVYHGYNAAFIVIGDDASCLVETGAPKDFLVVQSHIDQILTPDKPPLKYLFLTHQETPHSGGLARVLNAYPDVTLHGDVSDYHLAFPEFADRMHMMRLGDGLDLGNRRLVTVEPVVRDLRSTLWLFDEREHVLFPGDGLAYSHFHTEGHCGQLAEEAANLDLKEMSTVYSERALFWTKFVDMEPYIERFERLVRKHDVRVIAPTHGLPVGDVKKTLPLVMDGLRFGAEAEMTAQGDLAQAALAAQAGQA